jgi:ABC-type transporter Mla MlaB component
MLNVKQEIATLEGNLNPQTVTSLLTLGKAYIAKYENPHFDLQAVDGCDSSGLALLVCWWRFATLHDKHIHFSHLPKQAKSLSQVCMLDSLLMTENNGDLSK